MPRKHSSPLLQRRQMTSYLQDDSPGIAQRSRRRRAAFAAAGVGTNTPPPLSSSQRAFQQSQSDALGGRLICFIPDSSPVGNENTACVFLSTRSGVGSLLPSGYYMEIL